MSNADTLREVTVNGVRYFAAQDVERWHRASIARAEEWDALSERVEAAEALAARYEQALRELLDSVGVVLDDDRLGYIEVQLDPDALATARAALAAGGTQPG